MKGRTIGGGGKIAEVDRGYFVEYVKLANLKTNRRDPNCSAIKPASARL